MQCTQTRLNTNQWRIPHGWLFMTTMGSIHVPANESMRVQLDSRKLSDVSYKLNTGESKDSCKLHPGESKWTLAAPYEILPLKSDVPYFVYTFA